MKSLFAALTVLQAAGILANWNWDIIHYGIIDGFRWARPWPDDGSPLQGFIIPCKAAGSFVATQYKVSELYKNPPDGLSPWASQLNLLFNSRAYPGSWDGVNLHGDNRDMVMMEYKDVPIPVQNWVEKELSDEIGSKKRFMGVYRKPKEGESSVAPGDISSLPAEEKVLIIAPGEFYEILPLFVSKGSKCEGTLSDLTKRTPSEPY